MLSTCFAIHTAHGKKSLYFAMVILSTRIAPHHGGSSRHCLTHDSLGAHASSKPKCINVDRFSSFSTTDCRVSLYFTMVRPFLPQNCPFPRGDLDTVHGSLGPHKSTTQSATRSLQPFLQGSLVRQTDRPTDRLTDHATWSVTMACTT